MPIFKIYSKRKKGLPDVLTYDKLSDKMKNQVYHIWNDFFKQECFSKELTEYGRKYIYETICKEEGKKSLYFNGMFKELSPVVQVEKYFEELKETDKIIDVIEVTFFCIIRLEIAAKQRNKLIKITYTADKAIKELNNRFKENGVGYQFTNEQIIRIDNKLLHKETIQPTLDLLHEPEYKNANDEFLKAHEHFRFRRNQECLNECLKSFESTIKIVCHKNGWLYKETDTAKPLINLLLANNFFPNYNESQLSAVRQLLEGSIPTIRNKNSGHGQGTKKIVVADSLASYMLYISGATIRLILETQIDKEKSVNL